MYRTLFTLGIAAAIIVGLALTSRTLSKSTIQDGPSPISRSEELPEHVPYMFLFQHLKQLRKQGDRQRRLGKDGSGFQRRFKDAFVIRDDQFDQINAVALHCDSEVEKLDGKAKDIAEAFWEQYPPGNVPEGVIIPPPPQELKALQQMRNSAILRARDQLRAALGEEEFTRFTDLIKVRLTPGIKRTSNQ